ncbi:MAG: MerR family DNA-binding transcriptional regulator [Paludibacteraceae bacterium]|nr:MerR family DNA-binding transcriptional regulator [Paludibacteraceae bacterium]
MNQQKLKIGDFAKLCGVTVKTLRHYEKLGILIPKQVDRYSGYRYYSVGQMQKMAMIRQFQALGLSLGEIAALYQKEAHYPNQDVIAIKMSETQAQIDQLQTRLQQLQAMLKSRKQIEEMEGITIQSLPACIVASYQGVIKNYGELGLLCCNVIGPEMARLGCECPEPGYCFTRELNKEHSQENISIEYCEMVKEAKRDSDLIHFYHLDAVETAICYKHYGPYEGLYDSYSNLIAFAEKEGYLVIDTPRAVYVDGIWNQEDSAKWLTIIQLPVTR